MQQKIGTSVTRSDVAETVGFYPRAENRAPGTFFPASGRRPVLISTFWPLKQKTPTSGWCFFLFAKGYEKDIFAFSADGAEFF